jgi:predicted acyl esterase
VIQANQRLIAPDGIALTYDLHRPASTDKVPTVVLRTPYGRSKHLQEGRGWTRRGYAFVVGDVRGRYDSDGIWEPYLNERADGAQLLDWVVEQPWSDGRVVVIGGSYSGYTAWAMAVERPAAIAAIVSLGPSMSLARTKFSPSGILRLGEHAAWWAERADSRTSRDGLAALIFGEDPTLLDHLPVLDIGDRLGVCLPGWSAVVEAGPDAVAGEEITASELAAVRAPSLHVGGWHDLLVSETLEHWKLTGDADTPKRLLIGPWMHDLVFSETTRVGTLDHGPRSRVDWASELLDWLSDALAGRLPLRRSDTFVIGTESWRRGEEWPPPSAPEHHLLGSGILRSDPRNPFPSRAEAAERRSLLERSDAVRFTVPTVATRLEGWAQLHIAGTADSAVADWIARLLVVGSNGSVVEIAVAEATSGEHLAQLEVALGPLSIGLRTGEQLILEITANDLPRLARNTGGDRYRLATEELPHLIVQTLHDVQLTLPAIPDEERPS